MFLLGDLVQAIGVRQVTYALVLQTVVCLKFIPLLG